MSFDPNAHRDTSLQSWEEAASGWTRQQQAMREFSAPVSHWMIEAIVPQPGERVLELAAGLGETGMLAAELVAPMGGVVISDQAEAMLVGARARAIELGLSNVEFQVLNAEWIDLPVASVDAVLCRWGYMLMADPPAALTETRRVLRPGGPRSCSSVASASQRTGSRAPLRLAVPSGCGSCSSRRASLTCASRRSTCAGDTRASRSYGTRRSTSHVPSTTRCSTVPSRRSPRSTRPWQSASRPIPPPTARSTYRGARS